MGKVTRFFLADDDEDDIYLFREVLQQVNPDIVLITANNGNDALEKLNTDTLPDIIFLDLNMPRMGGKECLAVIKQNPSLRKVPIIVYTTSVYPGDIKDAHRGGATGFFVKPTHINELEKIVRGIVEGITDVSGALRHLEADTEHFYYTGAEV